MWDRLRKRPTSCSSSTLRELYSHGEENPLYVFVWDKLFQRLENTADACEQAADTMGTIIMKNC